MADAETAASMGLPSDNADALRRLRTAAASAGRLMRFMELSGSHTLNSFRSGLHSLLPANVRLMSGPGCSVCALSQPELDQIAGLLSRENTVLCACPDLIRVLSRGGSAPERLRMIYSPLESVKMAQAEPDRQHILAAVGYDMSATGTASAILEADQFFMGNFTVLASHRRVAPVIHSLVEKTDVPIDGFICPGNVAMVTGADAFASIVSVQGKSCVISGFEPQEMLMAMVRLVEMCAGGHPGLENLCGSSVSNAGDRHAQGILEQVFEATDAYWRGLGEVAGSGLRIRRKYARYDARVRYELPAVVPVESKGVSLCAKVVNGAAEPWQCPLFGAACTSEHPVGPSMMSSSGACNVQIKYGSRNQQIGGTNLIQGSGCQ